MYHKGLHEIWLNKIPNVGKGTTLAVPMDLAPILETCYELKNPAGRPTSTIILPDSCGHIVVYRHRRNKSLQFSLIGPRSKAIQLNRKNRAHTLIFRFNAVGLSFLTKKSVQELSDLSLPLNEWLPDFYFEPGGADDFQSIQEFILKELRKRLESSLSEFGVKQQLSWRFFQLVKLQQGKIKVKEAAKALGCSERYLRKVILHTTGLSPNYIIRIERMTQSFLLRKKYSNYTWSDIAHMAGFFDHSHMIEDYQALLGRSPGNIFRK